jgi:hypothetical protein
VPGRKPRLRDRDVDILLALAKMRILRTSDLSRLFFGAKGTCQKRLRKLYDAGLARAVVTDLAAENRYALTKLGHDLLVGALGDADMPPFRPAPRIDGRSIEHLDLLNGYRIAVALGAAEHGLELRTFLPDWDLRAKDPHATLVPDAIVALARSSGAAGPAGPSGQIVYALEVDTGTEAVSIVRRKFERYRERHALGQTLFGFCPSAVLVLTATERRARTLARQVDQLGSGGASPRVLFGIASTISPDGGIMSGLAFPRDLVTTAGPGGAAFQRGFLRRAA